MKRAICVLFLFCLAARTDAQDTTRVGKPAKAPKAEKGSSGKTSAQEPKQKAIPTEEQLAARKREAEALPLFATTDVLPITLVANFKALFKDRDTLSTKRFPARLVVAGGAGRNDTVDVNLRTRGHYRLARCAFAPMRVEFPKKETKGTPFEGQKALKLGTHCSKDDIMEQYVLREYLAYRVHALVSPLVFRVRLSKATYVDSASGKVIDTRYAIFVENEDHLAARASGILEEARGASFEDLDQDALLTLTLFEYMIGNTDYSIYALHNVRLVQSLAGVVRPIPYDFDFSGLVATRYSMPDPKLPIKSVRERLFRGPCKTMEQWAPTIARFRAAREQILALYTSQPDLDPSYQKNAQGYLEQFFQLLDRPRDLKRELVDGCNHNPGV
ncbi:MAG: hypothetical protein U0132_05980 [Gemmatimonadaceae bacterium]